MTVINTNVGALTARTYALQANDKMQTAMERLSSGLRINSAADDAAGMAVSNKMESQLRGMNVAIRNSQDGISLVQTAEAGMSEITNMVIRMRELAVQMDNGVYTDSDRSNAQLEVTALLAEIDKIASNTAFNDVKVLDGSYDTKIRAGNTNIETIDVKIGSLKSTDLGGVAVLTFPTANTAAGTRTDNGDNTQTSTLKSNEATKITINESTEMAAFGTSTSTITYALTGSQSGDYQVDANGTITSRAAVNFDKVSAANNTDNLVLTATETLAATSVAANGYTSSTTANGSVTSKATVQQADTITLNQSNELDAAISAAAASGTVVYKLGTGSDSAFSVNAGTGTVVSGSGVSAGNKTIEVEAFDIAATTVLNAVNSNLTYTSGAANAATLVVSAASATTFTIAAAEATTKLSVTATANDSTFNSAGLGLTFSVLSIDNTSKGAGNEDLDASHISFDGSGNITITGPQILGTTDAQYTFKIRATDGDATPNTEDMNVTLKLSKLTKIADETTTLTVSASDTYVDTITLTIAEAKDFVSGVDVSTTSDASRAVTILDKALNDLSSNQAKLGAIQNRLEHNIDNLSTGAMLTETALGRIIDADFARETSELSKQQILGQAATSMLAQANQSKQSILALLQ